MDERQTTVDPSAGLQRDPTAHGAGRLQCRHQSAGTEFQAHGATVDGVGVTRSVGYEGLRANVHADRPMQSGQSARTHQTPNAKATTQALPMVEDPARPGPTKDRTPWSRVGDKVSAIRLKACSQLPTWILRPNTITPG